MEAHNNNLRYEMLRLLRRTIVEITGSLFSGSLSKSTDQKVEFRRHHLRAVDPSIRANLEIVKAEALLYVHGTVVA
jgi:hypothetical protein